MTNWQETLAKLPWSPKHAEQSAKLALSRAAWLGIDREEAIQQVFELAIGNFFQANPHVPFEAWQTVTQEMGGRDDLALALA